MFLIKLGVASEVVAIGIFLMYVGMTRVAETWLGV